METNLHFSKYLLQVHPEFLPTVLAPRNVDIARTKPHRLKPVLLKTALRLLRLIPFAVFAGRC
jgi:hypothetical protein